LRRIARRSRTRATPGSSRILILGRSECSRKGAYTGARLQGSGLRKGGDLPSHVTWIETPWTKRSIYSRKGSSAEDGSREEEQSNSLIRYEPGEPDACPVREAARLHRASKKINQRCESTVEEARLILEKSPAEEVPGSRKVFKPRMEREEESTESE